jgi:hypothetical protein
MRSSVDLPHPLGPITETKSPCVTEMLAVESDAITSFFTGLKNVLWMFSTDSLGAVIASLSHGRACPGHPRLSRVSRQKRRGCHQNSGLPEFCAIEWRQTWMPATSATSAGMTVDTITV